jgi:phenylacetate-CoA ligase
MTRLDDALLTLRGVWKYRSFLQRSQYFPEGQVRLQQSAWLSALLQHCHRNVPWYAEHFRQHGVQVTGPDPFAELAKLPILTKPTVRERHAYFCAPTVAKRGLTFATSGTTGEPMVAYTTPEQWVMEQGIIWRHWKWAEYRFRDPMAIFRTYAPTPGQPKTRYDRIRNWTYFSVFQMDDPTLDQFAQQLQSWKPRYLRGYPSALLLLAQHANRRGWKLPGVRAAFTASEAVPAELRESLRSAFGIEVFDHYGQAEITCMLHECEAHQGLHLDWEYGLVELVPSATEGLFRIVATNLHNFAMPLLRYDTGDLAVGGWETCPCGRTAPLLKAIRGRADEFLVAKDGTRIPTVHLYTYFSKLGDVRRFQGLQREPGTLIVSLALWSGTADGPALFGKVRADLSEMTGLTIVVREEAEFMQTTEGKFPAFIQQVGR